MRPSRWILLGAMGGASHASCLGPTEIVVELSTDVPCDVVTANGVAIAIGPPGNDTNETSASTHACTTSSNLGSLVVVPSGAGPHSRQVPGGWVITWVSNGTMEAQALDATGNAIGRPVPLGILPNGSLPRAIGSDGTSVVAFSGNVQPDAGFVEVYAALLTADAGLSTGGVGVPPIAGVFPVDAGTYQALFGWMETITGQLRTVTADTVDTFVATDNGSAFSLARAGTTLYAVFDNYGTCVVSCMPSCNVPVPDFGVATCGWIRFAPTADGGSWGAVYNDTTKGQDRYSRTSASSSS